MYIYDYPSGLADATTQAHQRLVDDLTKHIAKHAASDVDARIDEERRRLNRTLVVIAENHSATTRSADLARRMLANDVYRFIASESFLNAGPHRIEIRKFLQATPTTLSSVVCPYKKLLEDLKRKPRFILFTGSRRDDNRDARLAQHFLEEAADRKLKRTTPGILICGIHHGSRVPKAGRGKTLRRRLEDAGFLVIGLRLATDDFDRAECRNNRRLRRTDMVWPVGETQTDANAIRLVDLVPAQAEYTVLPTKGSPFERVTDDAADGSSTLSMAERYELVVLARRMSESCRPDPCDKDEVRRGAVTR